MEAKAAAVFYRQEGEGPWKCADGCGHTTHVLHLISWGPAHARTRVCPRVYFTGYWDTLYLRMPILGTQAPSHQPFYEDLPYSHLTLSLGHMVLGLVIAKEVTHWYVSAEKWGDGL